MRNHARNRLLLIWSVVAALAASAILVVTVTRGGETDAASTPTTDPPPSVEVEPDPDVEPDLSQPDAPVSPDQLDVVVDAELTPETDAVAPYDDGVARPVARLRSTGGTESDIVLDELLVAFASDEDRDAFLDRWGGTMLEVDEVDEATGLTDHVVRVDPSTADRDRLAADLLAVEPHHVGTFAASDGRALDLMAVAAYESAVNGLDVSLNWLVAPAGVRQGTSEEDPSRAGNSVERASDAFRWNWISSTAAQRTGIDAAWQMIAGFGGVGNRVKMLIADGGFVYNADFPAEAKMRLGEWSRENRGSCTGGAACPWHGTDVTMAAMAKLDNRFGTAGPAYQVADLIAMEGSDRSTSRLFKDIRKVVKEERPHIVNMSFGGDVTAFQGSYERRANRWFEKIRDDYGALPFAAAGNDGIDVDSNDALTVPCELPAVVCVGGLDGNADRADGSNYGTKTGGGSVEIYGPMCFYGLVNHDVPGDSTTTTTCGTSMASPVVAGVAALVRAANPTLSARQVWQVMKDTAHTSSLGAEIGGGHHRRIDAYRAVATAMNRPYTAPEVVISDDTLLADIGPNDFLDLTATATNFATLDLPIQWFRGDGTAINSTPTTDAVVVGELGPGQHLFVARATDVMGNTGIDSVVIEIANQPPDVSISSPAANTYRYTVEEVLLAGSTSDADEYWQQLDDLMVSWVVRSTDAPDVVWSTTGHGATIPANTLGAGDYVVEFIGTDAVGESVVDSALLTMLEVPAGESLPDTTIIHPVIGYTDAIGSGTASVRLAATANDAQDGVIGGTSMRWTAAQGDTVFELCRGEAFSGGVGSDCGDVNVELGIPPEAPTNLEWTITVEVVDSAGLVARSSRIIEIGAAIG